MATQRLAPHELKTVGRTYLEGLIDRATNEGGFGRAAGVKESWRKLGPETKQMLFGAQLTKDLDNFMLGSKRLLENLNKSGTTHSALAMGSIGTLGVLGSAVLQGLLTGDWARAVEVAGGVGLSGIAIPNLAARVLFSPSGAKLLTGAATLPLRTPAFMTALGGKLLAAGKEDESSDAVPVAQATPTNPAPIQPDVRSNHFPSRRSVRHSLTE